MKNMSKILVALFWITISGCTGQHSEQGKYYKEREKVKAFTLQLLDDCLLQRKPHENMYYLKRLPDDAETLEMTSDPSTSYLNDWKGNILNEYTGVQETDGEFYRAIYIVQYEATGMYDVLGVIMDAFDKYYIKGFPGYFKKSLDPKKSYEVYVGKDYDDMVHFWKKAGFTKE